MPVPASAGIQEDARHHQVKVAAGALGRTAGTELLVELGNPIETAHVKMPPAAVERHIQIRIGITRDLSHVGGHLRELLRMIGEVAQPVSIRQLQHLLAAFADSHGRPQISNGVTLCAYKLWHRDSSNRRLGVLAVRDGFFAHL
jgi:hypothetical protein